MTLTRDIQTEVFVDSSVDGPGWQDITSRVRYAQAIEIGHGSRGISEGIPEPSACRLTLDCRDGLLWPSNPMSEFYPSLGLNTPLRVALGLVDHTFPGTVVDDWSDVGGYPVVNTGLGGTVANSDWQQTPGVATHSIPTTSAYRQTVLDGWDMEDCEQQVDFRLPFADTTGGAVEPANLIFRDTGTERWLVRVVVNTDETITVKWLDILDGVGEFTLTTTVTTPVLNSGQWITVKANVEASRVQTKLWLAGDPEPLEWDLNEGAATWIDYLTPGSIGIRTGIASGNTNAKPIVVEYRNWKVRSIRFHGEISQFPMETDVSGNEIRVPIVAAGETRRLKQGTPPTLSALARAILQQPGVQASWSLEDERGSTNFGSSLSGHPPMVPLTGTPGYAEYNDLESSQALPTGNGSDWRGDVPDYTDTGNLQVTFVLNLPTGGQADRSILCRWYTEHPSAKLWQIIYRTGGDLQLQAWNSESIFVYEAASSNFNLDGAGPHVVTVQLANNGSDVDWGIRALNVDAGGTTVFNGTATGLQLASCKSVWMNLQLLDTPAYGHVFVQSVLTDELALDDGPFAWNTPSFDGAPDRIDRLLTEDGYELTLILSAIKTPNTGVSMGAQRPGTRTALIEECITLDTFGVWSDGRTHAGIIYTERPALYNQPIWVTLSLAGKQLQPSWRPLIGDRDIRNRVTVSRVDGSKATFELESGPNSVQKRPDGVGPYGTTVTINADSDEFLQQIAAFRVAVGTIDEPAYPAAVVQLAAPAVVADPSIANRLLDLRPGRIFEVADAEAVYQFGPARLMCVGYTERLSPILHSFELIGEPVGPYSVLELEHSTLGALDSATSSLENGINSSQTTFTVAVGDSTLWVDTATHATMFPLDINVGGERMTVTGITTATPSFVSVGTAAHADNATVAPGAPAGAAAGDLLVALGATRDLASTPTISNSNYITLLDVASLVLWGRIWDGVEAMPTIGTTGGSAGSTVTGQIMALRNVPNVARATALFGNGSAQDMLIPALYSFMSKSLAIFAGQKQDDWTSVATLAGATEIADLPTTVGSDQGVVWDYQAFTGEVATPQQSFVVTGGASANSRTGVLLLGNWQTFTVTRSVNGVVKSHAAGTPVHLYSDHRYPL